MNSAVEGELVAVSPNRPVTGLQEFRRHWALLLAAVLGITVGIAAVPGQGISIFLRAMQQDLGWSRAEISLGPTILLLVLAAVSPLLGWVADRVRPVWICVVGMAGLSVSLFLLSRLGSNVGLYYAGCVLMGVIGAGSATVPYARAISTAFVRARGLALAVATIGTGLAGFVLPVALAPYAARAGWRLGFVALSVAVAAVTVIVALLMVASPAAMRQPRAERARERVAGSAAGVSLGTAVRGRTFWTLAVCFTLTNLGMGGLQLHLLPFLEDSGLGVPSAARIVSLAGIGLIICRTLIGGVFDRAFAPYVAAVVMAIAALCAISLAMFGAAAAPFGALTIGLATGSEIDLIGYLTARYFGAQSYGRIYGVFYLLSLAAAAVSVVFYGAVVDATKSYLPAIYTTGIMLGVCALLYVTLRRYPRLEAQHTIPAAVTA